MFTFFLLGKLKYKLKKLKYLHFQVGKYKRDNDKWYKSGKLV